MNGCWQCGKNNVDTAKYCTGCGAELGDAISQPPSQPNRGKKRLLLILAAIVLSLLLIGGLGCLFYFNCYLPQREQQSIGVFYEEKQADTTGEKPVQQEVSGNSKTVTEESHNAQTDEVEDNAAAYILPDSDSKYLSERDLQTLSTQELRLARNEIYARNGRKFDDQALQDYFNSKSWYRGTIAPKDFTKSMLNKYEIFNMDIIVTVEKQRDGTT